MSDLRDFLPPPPWEGPPIPEAFLRQFSLTPERIQLLQNINNALRRRTSLGLRQERIEHKPFWVLSWSNAYAEWYRGRTLMTPASEAAKQSRAARLRGDPRALSMAMALERTDWRPARVGDETILDANQVLVYGRARDIEAILRWLEPLPLYAYSFEAKTRGIYDPLGHLRVLLESWRRGELEED